MSSRQACKAKFMLISLAGQALGGSSCCAVSTLQCLSSKEQTISILLFSSFSFPTLLFMLVDALWDPASAL